MGDLGRVSWTGISLNWGPTGCLEAITPELSPKGWRGAKARTQEITPSYTQPLVCLILKGMACDDSCWVPISGFVIQPSMVLCSH